MTMPDERTRAVIQTRVFLHRVREDGSLPEAIRNEAHRLLRHYPTTGDMVVAAHNERVGSMPVGHAMFTPDIDKAWTE